MLLGQPECCEDSDSSVEYRCYCYWSRKVGFIQANNSEDFRAFQGTKDQPWLIQHKIVRHLVSCLIAKHDQNLLSVAAEQESLLGCRYLNTWCRGGLGISNPHLTDSGAEPMRLWLGRAAIPASTESTLGGRPVGGPLMGDGI